MISSEPHGRRAISFQEFAKYAFGFKPTRTSNLLSLAEFVELYKTKGESENSWSIDVSTLGEEYDLSVKNPNKVEVVDERTTADILNAIAELASGIVNEESLNFAKTLINS